MTSNPIGASAMLRTAEAALQIRGDAGPHQVKKPVKTAMALLGFCEPHVRLPLGAAAAATRRRLQELLAEADLEGGLP